MLVSSHHRKQIAVTWRHTHGETSMTTPFTHENVIKLAGVLGVAPELRRTANGNAVATLIVYNARASSPPASAVG